MKQCNLCGERKEISEFAIKRGEPSCSCRKCVSKRAMEYKRSRKGLVTKIYAHQRSHSVSRGHAMPTYTNKELYEWIVSQDDFEELYTKWVESGYNKYKQPSINRLDDSRGYSFDNIELITWKANEAKGHTVNNKSNMKAVIRNDGTEYESISAAVFDIGGTRTNLANAIKYGKPYRGFGWRYV